LHDVATGGTHPRRLWSRILSTQSGWGTWLGTLLDVRVGYEGTVEKNHRSRGLVLSLSGRGNCRKITRPAYRRLPSYNFPRQGSKFQDDSVPNLRAPQKAIGNLVRDGERWAWKGTAQSGEGNTESSEH